MSASLRPVRHFVMPSSLGGKLHAWRFLIARRVVQVAVLLLFFGTAHWGWKLLGQPLLSGNLSAAKLAGAVPLADPFAVLQVLATRHAVAGEAILGAVIVLAAYFALGGRVFCSWVCPMNAVTDAARWVRLRLAVRDVFAIPPGVRYAVLVLALALSVIAGVAAFEWISPIAMLHREIVYGAGLGLTSAAGVFLFDAFVLKHGWCGHLCPLGAFWSLAGRGAPVRVAFDDASCTRCGDCLKVCPEPRVLNFNEAARHGFVKSGECTNCAACIAVCPESSLRLALRTTTVPGTRTRYMYRVQKRLPMHPARRNDAMKRFLATFSFALLALAATAQQKPEAVDDKQFSLNKGSVFESATPAPFEFQDGAKTTRPLDGSGMPVMISHTIDDDLPITAEKNGCIRCHTPTGKTVRGAPPVPASHVAQGDKPAVTGKRWNCTACHAPQADVKPLVENTSR